jgi:hypothetical protein
LEKRKKNLLSLLGIEPWMSCPEPGAILTELFWLPYEQILWNLLVCVSGFCKEAVGPHYSD